MKRQGRIFKAGDQTPSTLTFREAFPEIASVEITVTESGEGNQGLGVRRFTERSVREVINCSSHLCAGQGVYLGDLLRHLVAGREPHAHLELPCASRNHAGHPCPNHFTLDILITYKS